MTKKNRRRLRSANGACDGGVPATFRLVLFSLERKRAKRGMRGRVAARRRGCELRRTPSRHSSNLHLKDETLHYVPVLTISVSLSRY